MNLDHYNKQLEDLALSEDKVFVDAANVIARTTRAVQDGGMSKEELIQLLEDQQKALQIITEMKQLAHKEKLNSVINGLLLMVKTLV